VVLNGKEIVKKIIVIPKKFVMRNKMNSILSLVTIAVFALLAMASWGSTNTEVQVTACKPKPSFTGQLTITIKSRHQDGTIIPNMVGKLFLVHQIIQDTTNCQHLVVLTQTIPFNTGMAGNFQYVTQSFTHANEGDLWRIEVDIPPVAGRYKGHRRLVAAKYSETTHLFDIFEIPGL
jgi:hypothetical protein